MSKPWSGRFTKETDRLVEEFGASLPFDRRLYREDITGSIAHARMLARQHIINLQEEAEILGGLRQVYQEIEAEAFVWDVADEDIHMAVERRLHEIIGETAGKLHTARSRNDQVATDMRLYTKRLCAEADRALQKLQAALIGLAEAHTEAILPGYTHTQRAQPVLLAHHLLAYVEMLGRDRDRFADCLRRADVCPLGAAALAGTTFPIDRHWVAKELGFAGVSRNSLDAVSDRDFVGDFLSAAALAMVHLSRLAEEVVLWSSGEFGFITLDDGYSTGSSIMPQKKNPDTAELVRGKSGRVFGHLMALLTTLKALPLAYNKDMQEDKEGFFDAADTLLACLAIMAGVVSTLTVNEGAMRAAADGGMMTATDLADALARRGLPFRQAHAVVGQLVRWCLENGRRLDDLRLDEFRMFSPLFDEEAIRAAGVEASVRARNVYGGTAPGQVLARLTEARERVAGGRT
jgi:argininosuccinate lyase